MKRILLVSMPFASVTQPSIGISLLKARLGEEGVPCDTRYLNIDFARMIGVDIYERFSYGDESLVGEWFFAQEYYSERLPDEQEYIRYLGQLSQSHQIPDDHFVNILSIKERIKPFIEHCMESISWEMYDIVGFTTMFEQNLASIALAHRIKLRDPTKTIVFGGANCSGEMGFELHRCFPIIDYICSDEADFSFPELVKRIRGQGSVGDIPGVIHRNNGNSVMAQGTQMVKDLDILPYPDYEDYFEQLSQFPSILSACRSINMETSRGCWWGERSQCTFCGLNAYSIGFRSKSKDRVIREIDHLIQKYVKRYSVNLVSMVDNIMDMKYFKQLLPELKERRLPVDLFYEIKSNLNENQVRMLAEAGIIYIQPGIESLNSHVLKLMAKGVSALQNTQLLKYCKQFGVIPAWNMLTRFPGEEVEDYRRMIDLLYNKVTHLPPPGSSGCFNLQRFSPYFSNPGKYGITNIRPKGTYRFIYPFEESKIFNLAYFFESDYKEDMEPPDYDKEIAEAVAYWNKCYENNEYLYSREISPSALLVEDGRSNAVVSQITLELAQKDIYEYCSRVRSLHSIVPYIRGKYKDYAVRARDISDFLEDMVALNMMANEDDKYLSLAVPLDEGFQRSKTAV